MPTPNLNAVITTAPLCNGGGGGGNSEPLEPLASALLVWDACIAVGSTVGAPCRCNNRQFTDNLNNTQGRVSLHLDQAAERNPLHGLPNISTSSP
jgi:hypothetical protein